MMDGLGSACRYEWKLISQNRFYKHTSKVKFRCVHVGQWNESDLSLKVKKKGRDLGNRGGGVWIKVWRKGISCAKDNYPQLVCEKKVTHYMGLSNIAGHLGIFSVASVECGPAR
jgi:hypothetical protein